MYAQHDAETTAPSLVAVRVLRITDSNGDCARYTPAGAALPNDALSRPLAFDEMRVADEPHPGCPTIPAADRMAGEIDDMLAELIAG